MSRSVKSKASRSTAADILEQLALACVLGDPSDAASAKAIRASLNALAKALAGTSLERNAAAILESLGKPGSEAERVALGEVGDRIEELQTLLAKHPVSGDARADASAQDPGCAPSAPAAEARAASVPAAPLSAPAAEAKAVPAPAAPPSAPAAPAAPAAVARDPEMVELFGDFVAESLEGLDRADAILLAADHGVADTEQVNALFRAFHSIKGVSGFLNIAEVTRLAHVTEALLDQVRKGSLELSHDALDAVFESSATMRRTLEELKKTVPQGLPDPIDPTLPALLSRIERATVAGPAPEAAPAPKPAAAVSAAPPGEPAAGVSEPAQANAEADAASAVPSEAVSAPAADADAASTPPPAQPGPRAAAAQPAPAAAHGDAPRARETVKVDLERVDNIVEMVGELIIVESMVVNAPELLGISDSKLRNYLSQMTKISRDLQNAAMRMRMVPVSGVFRKMARLVRDLSRKTGKLVQFVQIGESTEMDRSMVERIEDPLVHMIRNAIDHAIELPDERRAVGKQPMATIELSASHEGGSVAISLRDDGRGLPREKILKKARERGVIHDSGESLSDQEVYSLIFIPGFSTASQVTEISGRGVGMDVVKRSVEDMRGRVLVDSTRGAGTTFKLILPLTLAIIDGMMIACGEERYILPSLSIVESFRPTRDMVHALGDGTELICVRGEILPLLRLSTLFNVKGTPPPAEEARCVILESAGRKLGLLVDDILTQQQVVIKPLGEGLGNIELLAGAAILPDGRVGLILNVERLGGLAGRRRRGNNESNEAA